ncbi:MAG TPA: enoyl-ACP reductase [Phycisphaerae bacterium]|nr:enoyl-ACP reductase [Phycisphaerae bacterium]HNU46099.1 enoyl-ACP reductase [Phycisphaerae bacterium]
MGLLDDRKGLIFGIANDRSIACSIARHVLGEGATCGFPYLPGEKNERRVRKALEGIEVTDPWVAPCDVSSDADLDATFAAAAERFETLDFVVHSIAYADRAYLRPGAFALTPRAVFAQALDISAYSLVAIARRAAELMPRGGSVVGMSYYGSEKAIPGYNVMGVAKAALEACTRYLAAELGERAIRINTVSAGPVRTLSSMAVGGIDEIFDWVSRKAPLRRNIDADEVGKSVLYLLSDLSSGVTGENLYVDAGYSIMGV